MPTEQFVRVGGYTIRMRRGGDGPPLLLINGIGAPLEMFQPLSDRLAGRDLISFDLPGVGRSSTPAGPLRARALARLVAALLARLGLDAVDVLGYSLGGIVALELAHRYPARVRRLILCGTTPGYPAMPPSPLVLALMMTPARYYSPRLGAAIVPRIVGGRTARDPAALHAGLRLRLAHPPSLRGYTYQMLAVLGWSSQLWLHRLRPPTLVLHGGDDPLAPVFNARMMAARIPRAQLHVIPRAGHLFLLDDPDPAVRIIDEFLDQPEVDRERRW